MPFLERVFCWISAAVGSPSIPALLCIYRSSHPRVLALGSDDKSVLREKVRQIPSSWLLADLVLLPKQQIRQLSASTLHQTTLVWENVLGIEEGFVTPHRNTSALNVDILDP